MSGERKVSNGRALCFIGPTEALGKQRIKDPNNFFKKDILAT